MTASPPPATLTLSGKLFFGSLCAGTFGLGVWQIQRFFGKVELTQQREHALQQPPVPLEDHSYDHTITKASPSSFRLRSVDGFFLHRGEILVGPRGPPPGANLKGLFPGGSSSSGGGGMAASPQVRDS
jgi:cytochrome oxidase assembly protein ShyY1